ncbi:hypothetical protein P8625_00755 [Tenacibaculum tangerinum]|uniref:Carboxypeptidase regulatory-like domain-containing protein n=1 Tax=Tenacibaculum tangerinum TaxID=3038772 RepID=A0ABY8L711_9FLAO|nr:hypothetical protein [Tenacibaculum tangerinum]WGH75725.1 hypothetical protein P8625_00755 [Tenacibaculum tangerinum]
MKRKTLLYIIFTLHIGFVLSQNNTKNSIHTKELPIEKIFVHYNTNQIVSGEQFFYKLYCLNKNNQPSKISKIAYFEVINSKNESVLKQKINLNNGVGYGDFFINNTIETGTYKIISYTKWMNNYRTFFEDTIQIINPYTTDFESISETIQSAHKNLDVKKENELSTQNKRQKLTLDFLNNLSSGNYSVSVRLANSNDSYKKTLKNLNIGENFIQDDTFQKKIILPELRGNLIEGEIIPIDKSKGVKGLKIGLSIAGKKPITKIATTNKSGKFYFSVENLSTSEIILQVLDKKNTDYKISISNQKFSYNKKNNTVKAIALTPNEKDFILERSIYAQIENAYSLIKKDSSFYTSTSSSLLTSINQVVHLDDYTRFNSIRETIIEVLENVWFTKENNQFKIHVRDANKNTDTSFPSLLIVDGLIVSNHTDFFDFDPKKIKTVSLSQEKHVFGNNIYQGIMYVDTFKHNFGDDQMNYQKFTILKPLPFKKYYQENYSLNSKERIPDYRVQLFWEPNFDNNSKNLFFYTSDISGKFVIEVEGFDSSGNPISIQKFFTVK